MQSRPLSVHSARAILVLLLLTSSVAWSISPPNINEDIAWDEDPNTPEPEQTYAGVNAIAAAYTRARREEEKQLGLDPGTLGNLKMPSDAVWTAMTDDARALYLINAERTARAAMLPGVIGLPYAGVEAHLDQISENYGQRLHNYDLTNHYHDGPPSFRIERDPVIGSALYDQIVYPNDPSQTDPTQSAPIPWEPKNADGSPHYFGDGDGTCHEFMTRSENLAYFASTQPIPMPVERAIYYWLYVDKSEHWGHREATLLQDAPLSNPTDPWGYTNNQGSSQHEGFLGFFQRSSTDYHPFDGPYVYGSVVVMNIIDPVENSDGSCNYQITLRSEDLPLQDWYSTDSSTPSEPAPVPNHQTTPTPVETTTTPTETTTAQPSAERTQADQATPSSSNTTESLPSGAGSVNIWFLTSLLASARLWTHNRRTAQRF